MISDLRTEIRPAALSDIEGMSVVVDGAWRENYRNIFTPEIIERFTGQHRRDSFKSLLERGVDIRVLTVDGEIAALCAFQRSDASPDCAEIILMYVHPKHQRRGYGGRLLSYVLEELRRGGFTSAVLDTAEQNDGARRFYEKQGFSLQKQYEKGISYVTYMVEL